MLSPDKKTATAVTKKDSESRKKLNGYFLHKVGFKITCPEGQILRQVVTVCCQPYFNCGKNHTIKPCVVNGEMDQCVPCMKWQFNVQSSIYDNWKKYDCLSIDTANKICPGNLVPYILEDFGYHCECDTYHCYYGNPSSCHQKPTPCGVNQELNTTTGDCVPCRPHTFKTIIGCQPCSWDAESWRTSFDIQANSTDMNMTDAEKKGSTPQTLVPAVVTVASVLDKPGMLLDLIVLALLVLLVSFLVYKCRENCKRWIRKVITYCSYEKVAYEASQPASFSA